MICFPLELVPIHVLPPPPSLVELVVVQQAEASGRPANLDETKLWRRSSISSTTSSLGRFPSIAVWFLHSLRPAGLQPAGWRRQGWEEEQGVREKACGGRRTAGWRGGDWGERGEGTDWGRLGPLVLSLSPVSL
jgi:hypothetical protein